MNKVIEYRITCTGYLVPIITNYRDYSTTWYISEWKRLCNYYGIRSHANLADLQKIDYEAWMWGVKLEQFLTRLLM